MKLLRTLTDLDWRSAELTTALVMFMLGVVVLINPGNYDQGASTAWLRQIGVPSWLFAAVLIAKGSVITWMILSCHMRRITGFIAAMFWSALAVMVYLGTTAFSTIIIYTLFALINGWSFLLNKLGKVED